MRTLPGFISQIVQARVCLTRVTSLLLANERDNDFGSLLHGDKDAYSSTDTSARCTCAMQTRSTNTAKSTHHKGSLASGHQVCAYCVHASSSSTSATGEQQGGVSILGADLYWDDARSQPCLRDVRLEVNAGALVLIVGRVGSGKSSLLAAIAGEMNAGKAGFFGADGDGAAPGAGLVRVKGNVSYCAQQSWIQHMTCRHNILFGSDWDPQRYVCVCARAHIGVCDFLHPCDG